MRRFIICIGNRFVAEDAAGMAVFDRLRHMDIGFDVELIEGGTAGLNLLPHLEKGGRVIFVDTVREVTAPGEIAILSEKEIVSTLSPDHYGHEAGIPYLLSVMPKVCEGELPEEIYLVGIEGKYSHRVIDTAAELSLDLAINGAKDYR